MKNTLNENQLQLKSVYGLQFSVFRLQKDINFAQFHLPNGPLFVY